MLDERHVLEGRGLGTPFDVSGPPAELVLRLLKLVAKRIIRPQQNCGMTRWRMCALEVAERLRELNCDPIEGMAQIAMNVRHTPELRGRMFAELAQYVAAKRKAVEFATDPVAPPQSKLVVEFVRAVPQVAPSDALVRGVSRCPHSPTT